jgi:hypothetical protein
MDLVCQVARGQPEETLRRVSQITEELLPAEYHSNIIQRRTRQLESAVAHLPTLGEDN